MYEIVVIILLKKGLIHVYTGKGKGKTTAALGLAFRAIGHGFKVYMIQFIKGKGIEYGEVKSAKKWPNIEIVQFGRPEFVNKHLLTETDFQLAKEGLKHAEKILQEGKNDIVILDEICLAVDWKLLNTDDVIKLIKNKPKNIELILTGRDAPKEIIELADYVIENIVIKHPFTKGIEARKGIEY